MFEVVWPAGEVDYLVAFDRAGARIHRVGADAGEVIQFERQNFAVFVRRQFRRDQMLARMNVGRK